MDLFIYKIQQKIKGYTWTKHVKTIIKCKIKLKLNKILRKQNQLLYPNIFIFFKVNFTTYKYIKINFNVYDINHCSFILFWKKFIKKYHYN